MNSEVEEPKLRPIWIFAIIAMTAFPIGVSLSVAFYLWLSR